MRNGPARALSILVVAAAAACTTNGSLSYDETTGALSDTTSTSSASDSSTASSDAGTRPARPPRDHRPGPCVLDETTGHLVAAPTPGDDLRGGMQAPSDDTDPLACPEPPADGHRGPPPDGAPPADGRRGPPPTDATASDDTATTDDSAPPAPPEGAERDHRGPPPPDLRLHAFVYDADDSGDLDDSENAARAADTAAHCAALDARLIASADADGSGTLSREELDAAKPEEHAPDQAAVADAAPPDPQARCEARRAAILDAYDVNGDGTLTGDERTEFRVDARAKFRDAEPPAECTAPLQ